MGDGLLARYKHCHQRGHIFIWKACLNGKKMASGTAKNFVVDPERSETKKLTQFGSEYDARPY